MMPYSIIAFSRFLNPTSTVLTLIIMKIVTSWEVTQYDPVIPFGEMYFSHYPKGRKFIPD